MEAAIPHERDFGGSTEEEERRRQEREEHEQKREELERKRAQWRAWDRLPSREKDRLVLEQLGNDQLRIGELIDRLRALFTPEPFITDSAVRPTLMRLREAREVDRKKEPRSPGSKQIRYRWFRRQGLEGPIADLERTFHDDHERGE